MPDSSERMNATTSPSGFHDGEATEPFSGSPAIRRSRPWSSIIQMPDSSRLSVRDTNAIALSDGAQHGLAPDRVVIWRRAPDAGMISQIAGGPPPRSEEKR